MHGLSAASRLRDLQRYRIPAAGAAVVLVAILVGQALQVGPVPGTSDPSASGPITWTGAPAGSPGASAPAASAGSWGRYVLPPDRRLADLAATRIVGGRVATTSHFQLRALAGVAATDLASGIRVEPAATLTVTPGATADVASLAPTKALRDGTRYRFRLYAPDGSLAGTWVFTTDAPLHVVGRLPDDRTTHVPVTTGIEVTFDRDDPTDFGAHFQISPKVDGRFEQHERTWVFVPTHPLAPATIYTVTVTKGVGATGVPQVLAADVRWQFETLSTADQAQGTPRFVVPMTESRPGEPPVIVIDYGVPEGQAPATSWPYELYRLPTLAAAADAVTRLESRPWWADEAPAGTVIDTNRLQRVASGSTPLVQYQGEFGGTQYLRLPVRPDPGWYVLVLLREPRPTQAVLQVTNLAAFVQTTDTRTVAWLNDLGTMSPIAGATVAVHDGARLGVTDARGALLAPTPASLITYASEDNWQPAQPRVLTVQAPDGRALVAVVGLNTYWGYFNLPQSTSEARTPLASWWLVLSTDRSTYRSTDTIHAWGVVRSRDDLSVPSGIELRFESTSGDARPAIARASATATSRGVFSADVELRDVPHGGYRLGLYVGGKLLESQWIEVAEIRKPAYQIELASSHHVYVVGEPIKVAGNVAFFDGSRAPGLDVITSLADQMVEGTTGPDGRFTAGLTAKISYANEGWESSQVTSVPAAPEEGRIQGALNVVVFPANLWLEGEAVVSASHLAISGTVSQLDRAKVEASLAEGHWWNMQPAGTAIGGRAVAAKVIHVIPIRTQIGTTYDFIAKQVRPVYKYSSREETILTRTVWTDASGHLALGLTVPVPNDEYRVELSAKDAQGRTMRVAVSASQHVGGPEPYAYPYLVRQPGCGWPTVRSAVGETTSVAVREGSGALGNDGHYLFMIGERGLTDAVWQTSATFQHTFTAADLPGYQVRAVRLLPTGYQAVNPVDVRVDVATKTIGVSLVPERARYRPGDTVTIAVRTTGPDGRPIPADVIVRAVDEKLFASYGALDVDVADALLRMQPGGFLESFASHQLPYVVEGGCGGGGGDGRSDFRDSATFQQIRTGSDGRATVSFTVPDDLTSWHVSASAVSASLDSGSAAVLVPVGLPFFADAILAPEYLVGEQPVLVVRAYGDAIKAGDPVRFIVRSADLGMTQVSVTGSAFSPTSVKLPALAPGRYAVTIEAHAAAGGLSDTLTRTVVVVPSRLGRLEQRQQSVIGTITPPGGAGLTSYVVSDAGRGALVPILSELLAGDGARVDQAGAAAVARRLLVDEFGVPSADLAPVAFDMATYQRTGVALLPYASVDIELTATFALVAPDALASRDEALGFLRDKADSSETTVETRTIALAGLAGLGADVLDELRQTDSSQLSLWGRLWRAIGLQASGDENAARTVEREILAARAEQLGPWIRVDSGATEARTLYLTALMLELASGVGDQATALGLERYLASQPSTERVFAMQRLAYVRASLDRLPRAEARFAWSVAGERHEVTLKPGASFALMLTAQQRQSFTIERLAGDLMVSAAWTGPSDVGHLPATPEITISRTVTPASDAPRDRLVRVSLTVTFGAGVPVADFDVTDLTPSGLAPLASLGDWHDESSDNPIVLWPYAVDGQRVSWVLSPDSSHRSFTLAYSARVVSPGTYIWEPAVVQSTTAGVLGAHTAPATFRIL